MEPIIQDDNHRIKAYSNVDTKIDAGKREAIFVINTAAIDSDGEVVQPSGLRKKGYQGNPVIFSSHSYAFDPKALPIGSSRWVKSSVNDNGDDVILAKGYFSDKTQEARDVWGLIQDGVLRAASVGFKTLKASKPSTAEINVRPELKTCKSIIRDWELLEWSIIALPANNEALAVAVGKGIYSQKTLDMLSSKTENTIKATKEIIEAVKDEPVLQKSSPTEKELKLLIGKELEKMTKAMNHDKIIADVIEELSNRLK